MASINLTTVVNAALRYLGVLGSGGAATTQQLADALTTVNALINNKSGDRLMASSVAANSFALSSGVQSYSIGTGQTWNIALPEEIVSASIKIPNGITNGLRILNASEWGQQIDRDRQSYNVKGLFFTRGTGTPGGATGVVYLTPTPLGGNAEIIVWYSMTVFPDATTTITVEDSYARWLELASAIELAPMYPSAQIPSTLVQNLADAAATLRNLNASLFGDAPAAGQIASNAIPAQSIQPIAAEGGQ